MAKRTERRSNRRGAIEVTAWSASRISDYEMCPKKIALVTTGHKQPQTQPMLRGSRIHDAGESYLRDGGELHVAFSHFEDEMKALRSAKASAELQLAFREDWSECAWMDPDVRCRVKIDAAVVRSTKARLIDYKTGKPRQKDEEQIELYALAAFALLPKINVVDTELWYLNTGNVVEIRFTRKEDFDEIRERWEAKAQPMLDDRKFRPTPSRQACSWCGFGKSKGGPCDDEVT